MRKLEGELARAENLTKNLRYLGGILHTLEATKPIDASQIKKNGMKAIRALRADLNELNIAIDRIAGDVLKSKQC